MLAELTPDTSREAYAEHLKYFDIAIWMIDFRNRYPAGNLPEGRYKAILANLRRSRTYAETHTTSVPGGPALRLAKAIWAFDYRMMFPENHPLVAAEENHSAHLAYKHRKKSKSNRYPVWLAMEHFIKLRTEILGGIPDKVDEKEDICTPNPFTKALRGLDTCVQTSRRLKPRLLFGKILRVVAGTYPDNKTLLVALLKAAKVYAHWLQRPSGVVEIINLNQSYEVLLKAQYDNIGYLTNKDPKLNKAINALLYEMRIPLS